MVGVERDEYDWGSGKMSITLDAFDDGSRFLRLLQLYKLDDIIAVTFLDRHTQVLRFPI